MTFYNENDAYPEAWLRNLIEAGHLPAGTVDERSIVDLDPKDLAGYDACHFFAGIGGWPYALRLADWPDLPVWTGSCPCQPFSSAARGRHSATDLWPEWRRLIATSRPRTIFGEQIAAAHAWFDGVCDDLEAMGYEVWASILPACSIGSDHARPRIFFVGHAHGYGESGVPVNGEVARLSRPEADTGSLPAAHGVPARVGRLRAYGNAIVPQVAAEFVSAFMEAI